MREDTPVSTGGIERSSFQEKLWLAIVARPWFTILINALVIGVLLTQWAHLYVRNDVDNYLIKDDDFNYYEGLKEDFSNTEFLSVAFQADIFTTDVLELLKRLTEEVQGIEGIGKVQSLANADHIHGDGFTFAVRRFLKSVPDGEEELLKLRNQALSEELYVPGLLSRDGKVTGLIAYVRDTQKDDKVRKRIVDAVRDVLKRYERPGIEFHLSGWTVAHVALAEVLQRDMGIFLPACFVLILLTTFLLFRSPLLTFLASINILVSMFATISMFGLFGISINNLTTVVIPLCVALSLADTVHVFSRLERSVLSAAGGCRKRAIASVLREVAAPCLLTSLTTAAGFLSLLTCAVVSMQNFAVLSACSMVFEFAFTFFFLPALLALAPPEKVFVVQGNAVGKGFESALRLWSRYVERYSSLLLSGSILVLLCAVYFCFQVRVETNLIQYFKPDYPFRQASDFSGKHQGGTMNLEVSFRTEEMDGVKRLQNLEYIQAVEGYMKSLADIGFATSFVGYLKKMNQSFHAEDPEFYRLPESDDQVEQFLLMYDGRDLKDVVTLDFSHARIIARTAAHGSLARTSLVESVRGWIVEHPPPAGLQARVTGGIVNFINIDRELVRNQIQSFSIAVMVIGMMMTMLFRSIRLGGLSLLPNIAPVLMMFGFMGLFGIPLDTGTIMVASISLGIACDDTIHFLYDYQHYRKRESVCRSTHQSIVSKGRAIISSSLIASIGFGVLMLGSFIPIVHFGLLCAVTMVSAVLADLLLLPAMLFLYSQLRRSPLNEPLG
jgi:predicted RND superfamily exporter protein